MPKFKHGSGSVYKRGKTWWVAYYANGEQVCESAKTTDKAKARQYLQVKVGQVAEGKYVGPTADRVTFDELMEGLLTDYKVNRKRSLDIAERRTKKHLTPFFTGMKAHSMTTVDVQAYIAKRQEAKASNAEINRELSCLEACI